MPRKSHNLKGYEDQDIVQNCQLSLMTGVGQVDYKFFVDEWEMISNGRIEKLQFGDLVLTQRMEELTYYGEVAQALKDTNMQYANVTAWISEVIDIVFANSSYGSSQGATFANILQWSTLPDGLYHTELTHVSPFFLSIPHVTSSGD
jgi:hypothetical protein